MKKLEIYYLANKSDNIYFALLGDCSSGPNKEEQFDEEVEKEGIYQVERLNKKYMSHNIESKIEIPKFSFFYRKRFWNGKEECYLGWERKRGLLNQFNEYILGNEKDVFRTNTLETWKNRIDYKEKISNVLNIKYIITLDADTCLTLNTGLEMIGAMSHILNTPVLNKNKDVVIDGHALMQPRVGIDLEIAGKNLFTKIFAGNGGVDSYTNAISDVYQDNFGEGIFTGKGIYDLKVFSEVLNDEIPEDTVLSHDLLEGSYLRCGLTSDIMLMDGYPTSYNAYKTRLHRWIRGDFQIIQWLGKYIKTKKSDSKKNPLNSLSKYKIFDNIIRGIFPITALISLIYLVIVSNIQNIKLIFPITLILVSTIMPTILDIINRIIYRKEGPKNRKTFENRISTIVASIIRGIINIISLPDKAYISINAITKTLYRIFVSDKHFLEWTTSEETEKIAKTDIKSYYTNMIPNVVIGLLGIFYCLISKNNHIFIFLISILWLSAPAILWYISRKTKDIEVIKELSKQDKDYIYEVGLKTWLYFKENLSQENNYLPPDNYQEDRNPKAVDRTSSTNMGLGILSVISSYDLGYEEIVPTIELLDKMMNTIENLQRWNGHLYNWYNIKTLEPLIPRYISTVDSGNFIGYIYVLKQFYSNVLKIAKEVIEEKNKNYINKKVEENKLSLEKVDNKENFENKSNELENNKANNKENIKNESDELVNKEIDNKVNIKDENSKVNSEKINNKVNNETNYEKKSKLKLDLESLDLEELENLIKLIPEWTDKPIEQVQIANADFTKLYDEEKQIFSIGFNVEENKLTDSYYDLLASEARQASLVAISKKDVPHKHWYNLGRTLTTLDGYKGLISWSGTAFEYLMPNINIKKYKGSIIDESSKFMIMSQQEYAKKLGVPWGFSETAFNLKDLNNNYQYKAVGIPWLGLKRGLEDDIVVASYGSILAINENPKNIVENLKKLENEGMYNKYGFYEAIDYTPIRLKRGKKSEVVKTYMAHHQALILLSINNLFNDGILQKRFHLNPEIEAIDILLQERMPEDLIITKEEKIKPEKIKYINYESNCVRTYSKINGYLKPINVIANNGYSIVMDVCGHGYSKYNDILINKYKETSEENQGIFFYIKNIKDKRIWTSSHVNYLSEPDKYEVTFSEDSNKIKRIDGPIETKTEVTISPEDAVEIRKLELKNIGLDEETLEITSVIEPVLSNKKQEYAHPAFNNLFLKIDYIEDKNTFIVKRKDRNDKKYDMYMAVKMISNDAIGEFEYEVDKEKFQGRGNIGLPKMIEDSKPLSRKEKLSTDPILAIRKTIKLERDETKQINLIISVSKNKEEAIEKAQKYEDEQKIQRAFELSIARVDTEARYLGINYRDIENYQRLIGYLIRQNPIKKINIQNLQESIYAQSELWKYGISGDLPIILVKISDANEQYILDEIFKAYEYLNLKNIKADIVILNDEINSYENYVREIIQNSILNHNLIYKQNVNGGIFVIENCEEKDLLEFKANIVIDTKKGPIGRQLKDLEDEYLESIKILENEKETAQYIEEENSKPLDYDKLHYYNEYGGFLEDGKEYLIRVNRNDRTPTVWSNIMANEKFGTLVTESMGGYTWSENSRLNKITDWSNNQVIDPPSEVIYMQDKETLKTWSLGLNPMPDNNDYYITYGFGYSKYKHISSNISQELTIFVPKDEKAKINILKLENLEPKKKKLKFIYYINPVLAEEKTLSSGSIYIDYKSNNNIITLKNLSNDVFRDYVYVTCSEKINSYTGSKKSFIGKGNLSNPEGIKKVFLNNENNVIENSILAVQINIELEAFESKEISFVIGSEKDIVTCEDKAYKYSKISNCSNSYLEVKKYWEDIIQRIQISTPIKSFDLLMNGWIIYGTIVSRFYARTAFYQSGGAFGFRDQLQDTLAIKYFDKDMMKNQIIKHSKHQFIEGDVEHWWHEQTSRGIRTKFSDDLLWMVYLVEDYINYTGDKSILDIETPYRKGEILDDNTDEKYDEYIEAEEKEKIYYHCVRAIEKSLNFGENNLPKIGCGDWNDGFSKVGNKGKGESVWLGFFMFDILKKWIPIIKDRIEKLKCEPIKVEEDKIGILKDEQIEIEEDRIERYTKVMDMLKRTLNTNAWDGRWFKRAYTDDGDILGTLQNEECRIDSICQSWSIISDAADNDKKYISISSLENHLVDKENGIIKLLDPPFEKGKLEPGYIKAYLPGTRENGGQYTHAAIWAIIAETMLGFGDKAMELFRMISPIEHSKTKDSANKYKVEPYAIPADIYGIGNLAGRGGWTWYTGSSSWMYEAGIKYILGLNIQKDILKLNPCIPKDWKEYWVRYKHEDTIYNIKVKNPNEKNMGVEKILLDGREIEEKQIYMQNDGRVHDVECIL